LRGLFYLQLNVQSDLSFRIFTLLFLLLRFDSLLLLQLHVFKLELPCSQEHILNHNNTDVDYDIYDGEKSQTFANKTSVV
jgi:hypothetical protein